MSHIELLCCLRQLPSVRDKCMSSRCSYHRLQTTTTDIICTPNPEWLVGGRVLEPFKWLLEAMSHKQDRTGLCCWQIGPAMNSICARFCQGAPQQMYAQLQNESCKVPRLPYQAYGCAEWTAGAPGALAGLSFPAHQRIMLWGKLVRLGDCCCNPQHCCLHLLIARRAGLMHSP